MVLLAVLVYSIYGSAPSEIVVIEAETNREEVLSGLYKEGYFLNKFSYYTALVAARFMGPVKPGGYSLKKSLGALVINSSLESPDYKYIEIESGLRKEQIANQLSEEFGWSDLEKEEFINDLPICTFAAGEGYIAPGKYLIHKDDTPQNIRQRMEKRIYEIVDEIAAEEGINIFNTSQILTIASLIQKEAAGKADMNLISGIIWNRFFDEMPLQIDATLQYAKGEEGNWWPALYSRDKYIKSPYNTYLNKGLPPGPIANPSEAAIEAALKPKDTDCVFYLHDKRRNIHCSTTYQGHKNNISYYLN